MSYQPAHPFAGQIVGAILHDERTRRPDVVTLAPGRDDDDTPPPAAPAAMPAQLAA